MRRVPVFALCLWLWAAACLGQGPGSAPGYDHDRWVTRPVDIQRKFEAFKVSFDGADDDTGDGVPDFNRIPEWVAYEIKRFEGRVPSHGRPRWFTDDDLYAAGIAPVDASYVGVGERWNRGHLCMKHHAARISGEADRNTHILLNAAPQSALLNQRIWQDLEILTGNWADTYGRVWIVCGPIIGPNGPLMWIGRGVAPRVAVPPAFFKIVVRESSDPKRPHVLAFIYPNSEDESVLPRKKPYDHSKFQTTVDEIERQTGLDLLTALDDDVEDAIESVKGALDWR